MYQLTKFENLTCTTNSYEFAMQLVALGWTLISGEARGSD